MKWQDLDFTLHDLSLAWAEAIAVADYLHLSCLRCINFFCDRLYRQYLKCQIIDAYGTEVVFGLRVLLSSLSRMPLVVVSANTRWL
jgi:hypothetical protein